jgi:hypothetical protein
MRNILGLILLLASALAHADGYLFKEGRFPEGKVTMLQLTSQQKQLLTLYRKCRDNSMSPYIFTLTPQQSSTLLKESGLKPKRFAIFESFAGEAGIDLGFNVINRFSEESFEVPHKLLTPEKALREWEVNVMGWQPSSLAAPSPAQLASGICPGKAAGPNKSFKADSLRERP